MCVARLMDNKVHLMTEVNKIVLSRKQKMGLCVDCGVGDAKIKIML